MLRFYAEGFLDVFRFLARTSQILSMLPTQGKEFKPPPFEQDLIWLHETLLGMGLNMSATSAERFLTYIKNNVVSLDILKGLSDELSQRLVDELQSRLVFIVPANNERYYNPDIPIFGKEVSDKFNDINEDISEAGNCFALGRYTACIFHLMRIMEKAVQYFGIKLKVKLKKPIKDETWYQITRALKKAIEDLPETTQKKRETRDRYQATYAHLDSVRIAWRNKTMHPKITYTDEEAKTLLSAVEIFMKDLVSII